MINQKGNVLIITLVIILLLVGLVMYSQKGKSTSNDNPSPTPVPEIVDENGFKEYISKHLEISFKYPKDWYIDDSIGTIFITSFKTDNSEKGQPNDTQIQIQISYFPRCFPNFEDDLITPACGENLKINNKILSKEVKEINGATFYKYLILNQAYNKRETKLILQKDDELIEIYRTPNPSQFEKEFEAIISSIKFLPYKTPGFNIYNSKNFRVVLRATEKFNFEENPNSINLISNQGKITLFKASTNFDTFDSYLRNLKEIEGFEFNMDKLTYTGENSAVFEFSSNKEDYVYLYYMDNTVYTLFTKDQELYSDIKEVDIFLVPDKN